MFVTVLICLLLVGVLSLPIDLFFKTNSRSSKKAVFEVAWAFGLIRFRPTGSSKKKKKEKEPDEQKKSKKKRTGSMQLSFLRRLIKNKRFRDRIIGFFKDLLHAIHHKSGYLTVELGLDDPADTAMVVGHFYSLQYSILDPTEEFLKVTPIFNEETIEWDGYGEIRIFPAQIIGSVIQLLVSPTIWKGLYEAKRA